MEQIIRLGEWVILERGWLQKRRIMFAGESSPGIYSIVAEWTKSHNSAAYNIYFQKDQDKFPVYNGRLTVINVTSKELKFRFAKL
jgi:hypothetical protein